MEIKTTSVKDHKIKAVVYGASGAGKTTFGATAPKPIFASAEGGLLSIAEQKIDFVSIKSLQDLRDLYDYLKDQKHDYESVVIDSITEINEVIKRGIESKIGGQMKIQHWGELAKTIQNILTMFRNLNMHVIIIAQEDNVIDEDKISKIVPSLNGKSATKMAYFMDIVAYLKINKNGERVVLTEPHQRLLTKDRSRQIGNDKKPNFTEWAELIAKGLEVTEEKVKKVDTLDVSPPKFKGEK